VTAYFGLTNELCKMLENRVKKSQRNRSHIFRKALDSYLMKVNKEPFFANHQPCQKYPILGLKTVPVTIRRDQDDWLRKMAQLTGKRLSQLGREAIQSYLSEIEQK